MYLPTSWFSEDTPKKLHVNIKIIAKPIPHLNRKKKNLNFTTSMVFSIVTGWIGEATGSSAAAFYVSAFTVIVSGLLMAIIPVSRKVCKTPSKKEQDFTTEVAIPVG